MSMILSLLPMVVEEIEDSEDYHEEIERKKSERKRRETELNQTSYFLADKKNGLIVL